jgi:mannose/cellobiose epimerase-like protein (N-acyl-D-glucosamine 2-epimerase family)
MTTTNLAWYHMIDVHLTLICATDLAYTTITLEHAFALLAVASAVQLI